jgi:hypothetical protein
MAWIVSKMMARFSGQDIPTLWASNVRTNRALSRGNTRETPVKNRQNLKILNAADDDKRGLNFDQPSKNKAAKNAN